MCKESIAGGREEGARKTDEVRVSEETHSSPRLVPPASSLGVAALLSVAESLDQTSVSQSKVEGLLHCSPKGVCEKHKFSTFLQIH